MTTLNVAIPCRRFSVQVQLGPSEGLSIGEQFAVRAIAAGANSVDKLREALRLDHRIALDLCVGLLRGGFLLIDRETGSLEVSERLLEVMGSPTAPSEGWAIALASMRSSDSREYQLVQELVSGAVLPSWGMTGGDAKLHAPENDSLPTIAEIPKPQLMIAVASAVRSRYARAAREARPEDEPTLRYFPRQRVLDVSLAMQGSGGSSGADATRNRMIVQVRRVSSEADAPPDLRVVGPNYIPSSVRRAIAGGLKQLWERGVARGKNQFFDRVPSEPSTSQIDEPRAVDPIRALNEFGHNLPSEEETATFDATSLAERHSLLGELEHHAREQVIDAATYAAHPELIIGGRSTRELVLRALTEAKYQVILSCPWVQGVGRDDALRDALIDSVARGVRVFLLWGIGRDSDYSQEFSPRARELLDELAPRANRTGGLFYSQLPCAIHAKLALCDLSWVLVTSFNFLNVTNPGDDLELGVKLSVPFAEEAPSPAAFNWSSIDLRSVVPRGLTEIVSWARARLPDFRLQGAVSNDPILEGKRPFVSSLEIGTEVPAPNPEWPLFRRVWREEWARRQERLLQILREAGVRANPIGDGDHRQLLMEALASAERRVVVASERLGLGVLGAAPVDAMLAARSRGVAITIFFRDTIGVDGELQVRREKLESSGVRFERRRCHAKALVADGWCVLSSFNFLSLEGYFDNDRRARHELGVRVSDANMADAVVGALETAPNVA